MAEVIEIQRVKRLENIVGYSSFVSDLQTVYNLHAMDPSTLKWVEIKEGVMPELYPPILVLDIAQNTPQLAVNLHPQNENGDITGTVTYQAPLLMRDVGRWGLSDLRNHMITQWRGLLEQHTFFKKKDSYTLREFLDGIVEGLNDSVPIVQMVALLPISADRSYKTEFSPEIRFAASAHSHYKVAVIMEGAASAYSALTRGSRREIKDIDQHQNHYNWKADFIADLSDIERLMLPSSAGHMVLIAEPVEEVRPQLPDFGGGHMDFGDQFRGGSYDLKSLSLGGVTRGASIGGVSISQGTLTGKGSLFDGELRKSN